jgi:hypothetical protein
MHLPELDIQFPAFRLDVFMPGESSVQMEAKINIKVITVFCTLHSFTLTLRCTT